MPPAKQQPAKGGPREGWERVRTVFQPDKETDMPADEAAILRVQGLLVEDKSAAKTADSAESAPKE